MPQTTAYEREIRRREVVKLRAKGYTREEIAEELAVAESTVSRDIKRINSELSKLNDPEILKRELQQAAKLLLEEEYEDLSRADREQDERAKHRSKTSFRQTIELLRDVQEDITPVTEESGDDWLTEIDPELKERILEAAGESVEEILVE